MWQKCMGASPYPRKRGIVRNFVNKSNDWILKKKIEEKVKVAIELPVWMARSEGK